MADQTEQSAHPEGRESRIPGPRPENTTSTAGSGPRQSTLVEGPSRSRRWRRVTRWILLRIVFWYVVIVIVLGFFQRSLMYFPSRTARIDPAMSGLADGSVHDISFITEDGLKLHGWHVLAAGGLCETPRQCDEELARERLLVLFFHGNGGDRRGRTQEALIFAGHRADVFLIDYRGYGENPGSPSQKGLLADARAAWRYATESRGVAPSRIVLYGESLGGAVAVLLAAEVCRAGSPPAGLIVRSTFSSMTDAASYHYPWLPVRFVLLDRYPSIQHIGEVTCPQLHLHGTVDRVVPLSQGRKLFDAAPAASVPGVPKQFVELDGADHNDVLFRCYNEYDSAIGSFLQRLGER